MALKILNYRHANQIDVKDAYCRLHSIGSSTETENGKLRASARFRIYASVEASKPPQRDEDAPLPLHDCAMRPDGLYDFDVSFTYGKDEGIAPLAYAAAKELDLCKDAGDC